MKRNNNSIKLILCLFFFFIISLISVYSAQNITSDSMGNILIKQLIYYFIGIIVLLLSYYYKKSIIKYAYLWYFSFLFLLLLLLFLGTSINGSRCWLIIGPISFQPSEFMKVFLILVIAKIMDKYKLVRKMKKESKMLFLVFIILLIPTILTFLEPDTGVVIIYIIITISMIIYHGINKKWYYFTFSIILLLSCGFFYIYYFQHDLLINIFGENLFYRLDRLLNWSNGSGYQLENSLIVISASGLYGFGINKVPLYFPEASTDFIFTTFSSCFGFIGNIIFIIINILFDLAILSLINERTKKIDQYILIGFFTMILYQQIQNISMTIGLLPITGITLPFISYGGSSLLSYMFITGIILRISNEQKKFFN